MKLQSIQFYNEPINNKKPPIEVVQNEKFEVDDDEDEIDHNRDISVQISENSDDIPPCRICLSNVMEDKDNPLINPCNCKGTQGLLHLECLKSWMSSKRTHRVFSVHSEMYTWRAMSWELCSALYPFKIGFNGKRVSLLDFDVPKTKHLVFETFLKEGCEKATSKSIYILRINGIDRYRMGRSHDVEFHIEDISVSRFHGEVEITPTNKILIKDVKSKFGTQILSKGAQPIHKQEMTNNMFQIGRTWLMINYDTGSDRSGLFSWFCGKPKNTFDPQLKLTKEIQEEQQYFLNEQMESQLENDIENLQKDRDSVFYLDDNFYNKLVDLYINKEPLNRETSVFGPANETIDDYRREEGKRNDNSSNESTPDSNSSSPDENDEESNGNQRENYSNSILDNTPIDSPKGPSELHNMNRLFTKAVTNVKQPF